METIDKKIVALKKEIEALELQKQKELLRIEVEKLSKTKVEEEIIIQRKIYRDEYVPTWPVIPVKPIYHDKFYCITAANNGTTTYKLH